MEPVETFLVHYGVKGMRWGRRKERTAQAVDVKATPGRRVKTTGGKYQGPSEDAIKVAVYRQVAKKSTVDSLDNKQLQELVQRMNLEQQYSNLSSNRVGTGKQIARLLLGQVGDQHVDSMAGFATAKSGKPAAGTATRAGIGIAKSVAGVKGGGGGGKKKK
jgi:hypothetical protein